MADSTFKSGDLVTLRTGAMSYLGAKFPKGQVFRLDKQSSADTSVPCFVATSIPGGRDGQWLLRVADLEPVSVCSDVPGAAEKRNNPGWTFRAAPSDFDGPRILRELEAQGADYAVIVWGKGEHERIAIISHALFERTNSNLPGYDGADAVYASYYPLVSFGPFHGLQEALSRDDQRGWHVARNGDGSHCKLGALRGLVERLHAWERAQVRVNVAWGRVGNV